jgi:hypothetical protein
MYCNAVLARSQDRVHAVDACDCRAAAARFALIAGRRGVVEIEASRSLQKIAAGRGHIAQLRRGAGQDRASEQRITCRDERMIGEIAIRNERADAQAAACRFLDLYQRQMRDVDNA